VEPEGSLLHPQDPATRPYSEPDQSSPYPPSQFLKIHFNIILSPKPGYSKWLLSPRFPHQTHVCNSPLPHTCYASRLFHSFLFNRPNNIWWRPQIIKLLIMYSSPLPCYLIPLRLKYPQNSILKHPQPTFLPQCEWLSFTPIQIFKQNCSSVYLQLYIFG